LENFTDIKINSWEKNLLAKKCFFLFIDNKNIFAEDEKQRFLEETDKILKHRFSILSKEITFGKKINWHTNFAGKSWPNIPYQILNQKHFNFRSKEYIGDVKLPWEFSKHLHFQDLAKAYLLTGDEKYAREFALEIENWLSDNPYEFGVNWTQGLIVAQRAVSWIIALSVFAQSFSLSEKLLKKIIFSLYQHALFIEKTYEIGIRSTNHLLGELTAQIILSVVFPEFKNSQKRLKFAKYQLGKELKLQIYADGVDYEKSTNYQRYILEFLFLLLMLEKRGLLTVPSAFKKKAELMTEFLMHMTQPKGLLQPISDADGARVFVLGQDINDIRPHLALASWLFNRADFKYVSEERTDEIAWFLSNDELLKLNKITPEVPAKTSVVFKEGGYWVSRQNWSKDSSWLFFDCGLMGLGQWPPDFSVGVHGHSDILNFGLALGEETFITDNGSYSYTTELPFHQYFRGASAHNVAIVDNQDQNIIENSPWMAKQVARPRNQSYYFGSELAYVSGEHTGYLRLKNRILAKREIIFFKKRKFILIKDSFLGQGNHQINEIFHCFRGLKIIKRKNCFKIKAKRNILVVKPLGPANLSHFFGQKKPIRGWYSPDYGRKEKTHSLDVHFNLSCPASVYLLLSWGEAKFSNQTLIELFGRTIKSINKKIITIAKPSEAPVEIWPQKFKGFIGRRISNLYFKHPLLAKFLSSLGLIKRLLRPKIQKMIDQGLNKDNFSRKA